MNPDDVLKLDNQLCFPLYAAAREIIKRYGPALSEVDLTYTQYIAMMVLWEEKQISVKDLGKRLYLDSGTLTPVLKSMESKGLLTRRRDPRDERVVIAEITPEGEALKSRALTVPQAVAACVKLEPEEAATLYRLLYRLLAGLSEEA